MKKAQIYLDFDGYQPKKVKLNVMHQGVDGSQ